MCPVWYFYEVQNIRKLDSSVQEQRYPGAMTDREEQERECPELWEGVSSTDKGRAGSGTRGWLS